MPGTWKQLNGRLLTDEMNGQAGGDKHRSESQILIVLFIYHAGVSLLYNTALVPAV